MILYVSIIPYFDLVVLIYTYLIISIPIVAVSERSTWCHGGLHCCGFLPHFGVKFPVWCPVLFAGQIPRSGCDLMLLTSTCSRVCVCVWKAMYIYNYTYMYIYIYSPWILIIQWKKTWNIMIDSDHQNLWLTHKPTTFPAYRDFDFATSHPNWSIARWIRVIATLPKEKGDGDESTRFFFFSWACRRNPSVHAKESVKYVT
jgi:hypothetical protein